MIECLWDIFGGTITEQGFKLLDSHIGAIYGDAITLERCDLICEKLKEKRFSSLNMVFGIGSYTYQYNTRDTLGFAMKSTLCVIDGKEVPIFKDPVTDDGVKKSAKGEVQVNSDFGELFYTDNLTLSGSENGLLECVFEAGELLRIQTLSEIRNLIRGQNDN